MTVTFWSFTSAILYSSILVALIVIVKDVFVDSQKYLVWILASIVAALRSLFIFEIKLPTNALSQSIDMWIADFEIAYPWIYEIKRFFMSDIIQTIFVVIWVGVAALLLINLVVSYFIDFYKESKKLVGSNDPRLLEVLQQVKKDMDFSKDVRIFQSAKTPSPYVLGFNKPTIYLNYSCETAGQQYTTIMHEITHFLHKDHWIKLISIVAVCLLWWNPIVWFIEAQVTAAIEFRCDKAVYAKVSKFLVGEYGAAILNTSRYCRKFVHATSLGVLKNFFLIRPFKKRFGLTLSNSSLNDRLVHQRVGMFLPVIKIPKKESSFMMVLVTFILIIISSIAFLFPIVERTTPPISNFQHFESTSENSYLIDNGDGTYSFYLDDVLVGRNISESSRVAQFPNIEVKN